ncbi:hypothetical protein Acor_29430 [Acrocarpospora corrugata]|uniref:Uncharacterized protein n=1 Tax=Acrocarpospora corrugata TaxID=35763 RepID=A0A5M3VXQ6_9ACTN|nr:hypothetical protein Acor_29430 [Acrocarpospora corrugata]
MDVDEAERSRDLPEAMRAGVRARISRLARATGSEARRWTPPTLIAMLAAGAFAPLLVSGVGAAAMAAAGVAALASVGGNVLTDVIRAVFSRA